MYDKLLLYGHNAMTRYILFQAGKLEIFFKNLGTYFKLGYPEKIF